MEKSNEQVTKEELFLGVWMAGIWMELFLSVGKMAGGIFGMAPVLVTDSLRSLTAVWTEMAFFVEADRQTRENGYKGHGWKILAVCLSALSICVLAVCYVVLRIYLTMADSYRMPLPPGMIACIIPALVILVKRAASYYLRLVALETHSSAMMADSWRQRSEEIRGWFVLAAVIASLFQIPYVELLMMILLTITIVRDVFEILADLIWYRA